MFSCTVVQVVLNHMFESVLVRDYKLSEAGRDSQLLHFNLPSIAAVRCAGMTLGPEPLWLFPFPLYFPSAPRSELLMTEPPTFLPRKIPHAKFSPGTSVRQDWKANLWRGCQILAKRIPRYFKVVGIQMFFSLKMFFPLKVANHCKKAQLDRRPGPSCSIL